MTGSTEGTPASAGMIREKKVTWEDVDRAWPNINSFGTLSTALPTSSEWYNTTFLLPHEPFRFNMLLMERAVQPAYFQPQRAWKVERFFHWYDTVFDHAVHHHHDTEESLVFPFLHTNPSIKLPARLEEDHVVLVKNMDGVKSMKIQFQAALAAKDNAKLDSLAEELRGKVSELCRQMFEHLSAEEEIIAPLLQQHIKEAAMQDVVEKIIKSSGTFIFTSASEIARGQYRSGGEPAVQSFLSKMPPPLRWHYKKFTQSWVDGENIAVIQSLCFDTDLPPLLPKKKGFWYFRHYSQQEIDQFYAMPFKRATQTPQ